MFRYTLSCRWIQTGWIWSLCAALILSIPASALAVRPGEVSLAAEITAAQRAVAAMHPDEKIRNPDYLAEKFVGDDFWHYYHYSRDFKTSMLLVKTFRLGGYYYVNARTKHIDKLLEESAENGAKQVVVLGAGFDSRAYRFEKDYPKVTFFEVDHPTTSAYKQALVKRIIGRTPSNVVFAPIDFNTQNITDVLTKAGYDPKQITFFIWEGVTFYITEAAVDKTLQFIATQSAPGSAVVFDYLPKAAIQGNDRKYQRIRRMSFRMRLAGEPLMSGFPQDTKATESYINDRGLKVLSNIGPQDLTQMYLMGSNGKPDGQPSQHFRIIHARVPSP